ncbi:hypothetical protein HMI54_002882, partial [Coelomomyces lativittatus]
KECIVPEGRIEMEILRNTWDDTKLESFKEVHTMGYFLNWKLQDVKKFKGLTTPQLSYVFTTTPIPNNEPAKIQILELRSEFSFFTTPAFISKMTIPIRTFAHALKTLLDFKDDEISFFLETCHQHRDYDKALSHLVACF